MIDERIADVVKKHVVSWGDRKPTQSDYTSLREEIAKKTGRYKNAPFSLIKKWVSAVRRQLLKERKHQQVAVKEEKTPPIAPPFEPPPLSTHLLSQPVASPQPQNPINEHIYLQNIYHEIAGMRRTVEKVKKDLESLEERLKSKL